MLEIRGEFLYMPSPLQQNMNIRDVDNKYKLTNVIAGVDGGSFPIWAITTGDSSWENSHRFHKSERSLFNKRANFCGIYRRIYDILCQAPGSFHDAAIWGQSDFLAWFRTEFSHKFILVDSAYP